MSTQYNEYLGNHIYQVHNAFSWLKNNLPELLSEVDVEKLSTLVSNHDKSKHSFQEYSAYDNYFYGVKDDACREAFDKAWLHHQNYNPHHWQYWLLLKDEGEIKPLEMPKEYVVEMFCDHWSFSWTKDNLYEIFDWYKENKPKMKLHLATQSFYESILDAVRRALDKELDEVTNG